MAVVERADSRRAVTPTNGLEIDPAKRLIHDQLGVKVMVSLVPPLALIFLMLGTIF